MLGRTSPGHPVASSQCRRDSPGPARSRASCAGASSPPCGGGKLNALEEKISAWGAPAPTPRSRRTVSPPRQGASPPRCSASPPRASGRMRESPRRLGRLQSPQPLTRSSAEFHCDTTAAAQGGRTPGRPPPPSNVPRWAAATNSRPAAQFLEEAPPVAHARPTSALEFYAVGKLLGRGAFGKVNVGVHKHTEELTAMKLCERKRIAELQAKKCLMQEVSILKRLNGHPNIIQLYEVIETTAHLVLVMEFAAGGDLLRYVRQRRKLTEECAQGLFKQLLSGIGHIHAMGVVHRDIKLENLLLDAFGCLKIADFGVAVVVEPLNRRLHEHCGTPSYIAPEILMELGYEGQPVDVWSSGVVLYAMLSGRVPFKGDHASDLKQAIIRGKFNMPPYLSSEAAELLRMLLVVDANRRGTIRDAMGHPWLLGVVDRAEEVYGVATSALRALRAAACGLCDSEEGRPPADLAMGALLEDPATEELLGRVARCGFPRASVEESLRQGKLNHATATFHLLAHQEVRRKAAAAAAASAAVGRASSTQALARNEALRIDVPELCGDAQLDGDDNSSS